MKAHHHITTSPHHLINLTVLRSYALTVFFLSSICFLLLPGCNHKKNTALDEKINEIVAADSLFVPTGNAELDSLILLTANAPIDTNLVELYFRIGNLYDNYDFEKAKEYYLKMKELSESLNWSKGCYLFSSFASILAREGLIDSSLVIYQQALKLAENEKNEEQIAFAKIHIATVYSANERFETALQYLFEALPYFEKINDEETMGSIYWRICDVYRQLNLIEKSIEYGEKSVAIRRSDPYALTSLAESYGMVKEQFEKSNQYFEEALHICKQQNNVYLAGIIYCRMGANFTELFNLEKAKKNALQALTINKEMDNISFYALSLILISKVEGLLGNYSKSEEYIKEALKIAEEYDEVKMKIVCYKILSELSFAQRDYRENMQYLGKLDSVEVELATLMNIQIATEHEAKYETEKKQLEIEKQQQINKLQRNYYLGGIAVCIGILALLYFLLRARTRQKQILAEINATKDKFFTIISHDLKSPAVAQRNFIKILIDSKKPDDEEVVMLNKLLHSADSQLELLYNLLSWAKLQTGRMQYCPVQFNLATELRKDSFLHFHNLAKNKEIALQFITPEPLFVTADVNMMNTVIRNLLDNAIKFTPRGGKVTLEIAQTGINKGINPLAPTTRISVSDTGMGMTEEQIRKLIGRDAMNRVSTRGTAGEAGTGLGLTVCKELLEKHGSTLHIESEPGKGSTFWFEINNAGHFPTSNAIWNESVERRSRYYGLLGDTIINEKLYSKLYQFSDTVLLYDKIKGCVGALRNEVQKVFFKPGYTPSPEILLYDFGAKVGDTVWHNAKMVYDEYYHDYYIEYCSDSVL